jgi:hypothetical protein
MGFSRIDYVSELKTLNAQLNTAAAANIEHKAVNEEDFVIDITELAQIEKRTKEIILDICENLERCANDIVINEEIVNPTFGKSVDEILLERMVTKKGFFDVQLGETRDNKEYHMISSTEPVE